MNSIGNRIVGAGDWSGNFIRTPDLDNGAIAPINAARLLAGTLSISNNGSDIFVDSIYLDDDGNGTDDDFGFFFPLTSFVAGQPYSFEGTATFSLAELGEPDLGSEATFDDWVVGMFTTFNVTAPNTGSMTLDISTVPEPGSATISVVALMLISSCNRYRRKR